MQRKVLVSLAATALSISAWGCSSSTSGKESAMQDPSAWVQSPVFDQMNTVVRGIDYLPFDYKVDGCYARALYMSMELASNKLESNAIFAFAQPHTALVVGPIRWGYHVAPLLEVGPDESSLVPMVLDPSIASVPLTQQDWIAKMGHSDPNADDYPLTLLVPGSDYAPAEAKRERTWMNVDMPDFAHLPAFKGSDINNACAVMFSYLVLESEQPGVATDSAAKQDKLVSRTSELLQILSDEDKLNNDAAFSPDNCRLGVKPR